MAIIYLITNQINNRQYIGRTYKTIEKRWTEHVSASKNKECGMLLPLAIAKHGVENFTQIILETCDDDIVGLREMYWINELKSHVEHGGYNLTLGGDGGMFGYKASEQTKKKIGDSHRGQKRSDEAKENMSKAATGRIMSPEAIEKTAKAKRGVKQKPETIEARNKANTGKKRSKEAKENMSKAQLNRNYRHSDETKKLISNATRGKTPPNKGVPHTKEAKERMSKALKGKEFKRKTIQQFHINGNLLGEFISIANASRLSGVSTSSINRSLAYKKSVCHIYIWKYKE